MLDPRHSNISVVVPVRNNAEKLPRLLQELHRVLDPNFLEYELIVVDDASTDDSREIVERLQISNDRLRLIEHSEFMGMGTAFHTGAASARYDVVVFFEGTARYEPEEVLRLVPKLQAHTVVAGARKRPSAGIFQSKLIGAFNRWVRKVYGLVGRDSACSFRVFNRKELIEILPIESPYSFAVAELAIKAQNKKFKWLEVEVSDYGNKFTKVLSHRQFVDVLRGMVHPRFDPYRRRGWSTSWRVALCRVLYGLLGAWSPRSGSAVPVFGVFYLPGLALLSISIWVLVRYGLIPTQYIRSVGIAYLFSDWVILSIGLFVTGINALAMGTFTTVLSRTGLLIAQNTYSNYQLFARKVLIGSFVFLVLGCAGVGHLAWGGRHFFGDGGRTWEMLGVTICLTLSIQTLFSSALFQLVHFRRLPLGRKVSQPQKRAA